MNKRIYLDHSGRAKLREIFKCSSVQVWKALAFKSDSEMARRIRNVALCQLGGTPSWDVLQDVETSHDESDGTMVQLFGGGVKLVVSKRTGDVELYAGDKLLERHVNVDIPTFVGLQRAAGCLAFSRQDWKS